MGRNAHANTMSEKDALDRARQLIDQGNAEDASKLLWPLCESRNRVTRLNAIFALLVALNPITENDKLVLLADKGIETAAHLGLRDERAYLLSRKVFYLLNHLSLLVHRLKNLTLSARVFKWIDFSLERDKKEYDAISKRRADIEKEIASTATLVEKLAEECTDHRVRGQLFESIGDYYSTWFFLDCLDLQRGGRIRAKIFNLRFVRRWNLTYFLYDRECSRGTERDCPSQRSLSATFVAEMETTAPPTSGCSRSPGSLPLPVAICRLFRTRSRDRLIVAHVL